MDSVDTNHDEVLVLLSAKLCHRNRSTLCLPDPIYRGPTDLVRYLVCSEYFCDKSFESFVNHFIKGQTYSCLYLPSSHIQPPNSVPSGPSLYCLFGPLSLFGLAADAFSEIAFLFPNCQFPTVYGVPIIRVHGADYNSSSD